MQLLDRRDKLGVGVQPESGDEPGRPHHAQRVVEEGHLGLERRPETLGGQIGRPAEGVDELGRGKTQRHRVDREVTPGQVGLDVVGERHLGLAALGPVHLGPERGDLDADAVLLAADRAEPLALEPHVIRPAPHDPLDLVRTGVGGDVDVALLVGRQVEEGVTDAAAHQRALVPARDEPPGELLGG